MDKQMDKISTSGINIMPSMDEALQSARLKFSTPWKTIKNLAMLGSLINARAQKLSGLYSVTVPGAFSREDLLLWFVFGLFLNVNPILAGLIFTTSILSLGRVKFPVLIL